MFVFFKFLSHVYAWLFYFPCPIGQITYCDPSTMPIGDDGSQPILTAQQI